MSGQFFKKGSYRSKRGGHASVGPTLHKAGDGTVRLASTSHDAGRTGNDPTRMLRTQIREALDPMRASSKPKTWANMTEEEKAEMRRLYEKKP